MGDSSNLIVVVGSNMMDFTSYAPRLPKEGETLHGTKFVTTFGGKGANQCVAAAKLGGKTAFVGRIGGDIFGDQYLQNLKDQNVDVSHVKKTPGHSNGVAQIIVSNAGQNQIVIVGGANDKLCIEDVDAAKDLIEKAAVIICQLETSPDVAIRTMELCKGISILNGAPVGSYSDIRLLTLPTIFCVNESEASAFSLMPVNNLTEAKTAAQALLNMGCQSVILTLGKEGALYVSQQSRDPVHIRCNSTKCVDSTGAGDAFIGALAYLLMNRSDLNMIATIEAACFVASDSVTRLGTQTSFPGPEVLERYFK